jgi:hypothetical protein
VIIFPSYLRHCKKALPDGILTKSQQRVQAECNTVQETLSSHRRDLSAKQQKLSDEIRLMESTAAKLDKIVKLNVGGTSFVTSRTTLMSQAGMLASMFSGVIEGGGGGGGLGGGGEAG